jgi:multidrug resistance efflux pump
MTRTTRLLSIVLPACGSVLIAALLVASSRRQPHADPLTPPPVSVYKDSIAATGIVEAAGRNYNLAPPIAGQVLRVFVKENQEVRKGDPLYRIDDSEQRTVVETAVANAEKARAQITVTESDIATQQANVESAAAAVESARSSYEDAAQIAERNGGLHQQGILSDRDYITSTKTRDALNAKWEQAKAQLALAKAQLSNAQARLQQDKSSLLASLATLDQQRVLLDKLEVRAPRDGRVLQVNTREGEYLSTTPSTTPILFGDTDALQVRADVDEINASRVSPGSPAMASLKGDSSRKFPLEFMRIDPYMLPKQNLTGSNSERVDVRVLQVIYQFKPPAFPVYVGQQVDVFIDAKQNN